MPRFTAAAAPLLGCLAIGLTACPAQAQYLYVGFNNSGSSATQDFTTPGKATMTAGGTSASGNYAFVNANPSTTSFIQLTTYNTSTLTVSGGSFQYLVVDDASIVNLLGSAFAESSTFHGSSTGDSYYTISGLLQGDSTPFTANYYANSTGTLEFNGVVAVPGTGAVPEATTSFSLGLLLLGIGVIAARRRKISA